MLRFIRIVESVPEVLVPFQYISCYGLSLNAMALAKKRNIFQYISCYGLSGPRNPELEENQNFNTSHVTVYRDSQTQKYSWEIISIHLMLRFIYVTFPDRKLCVPISIHLMLRFIQATANAISLLFSDFNTSHVTVYLSASKCAVFNNPHFNTSHVTVYPVSYA